MTPATSDVRGVGLQEALLLYRLGENPFRSRSTDEVATMLGVRRTRAIVKLAALRDAGLVHRLRSGWQLTPSGRDLVERTRP